MSTQQTKMAFEEVVIQPAFAYDGKTYLVGNDFEVGDTAYVLDAGGGDLAVRTAPDPDAECEVAERGEVLSGKLTLKQWREFINEIEGALDELVVSGRTESDRLELRLPAEI
jgi:hypothetical protein